MKISSSKHFEILSLAFLSTTTILYSLSFKRNNLMNISSTQSSILNPNFSKYNYIFFRNFQSKLANVPRNACVCYKFILKYLIRNYFYDQFILLI